MNCEQARQAWHLRLENEVSNEALDRHVAECADCRRYVTDLERFTLALTRLREETESVRSVAGSNRRIYPQAMGSLVRFAAVIMITAGLYGALRLTTSDTPSPVAVHDIPPGTDATPAADRLASDTAPRALGITLRGESAQMLLAVATTTNNPDVAMYWLYPTLVEKKGP